MKGRGRTWTTASGGWTSSPGRTWKIRPRREPGERVGHEYWFADGTHVGYHGTLVDGTHLYGAARFDDAERTEAPIAGRSSHFHSNDLGLIVGDGSAGYPYILLWRYRDGQFQGPRKLCRHRGSFHVQQLHVHPRFSPDGKRVLFTADPNGYGNLYLADVRDFDSLPPAEMPRR